MDKQLTPTPFLWSGRRADAWFPMEMVLVFIQYPGRDIQVGGLEIIAAPAAQTASMEAAALPE